MELYNTNKRKWNDEENRGYKLFLLLLVGRTKDKRKRKFWMEVTMVTEFIPWRQDRRPLSWHQRSWRESQRWLCLDMRRGVLIFSHPDPAASYLRCRRCRARTSIRSWQRWKLHQQPRSGPKFLVRFKHPEVLRRTQLSRVGDRQIVNKHLQA